MDARDGGVTQRIVRDGKVVEGRDGFLFLAHDGNQVLDQHTGELRLNPEQLERWRVVLESRTQLAARKGCAHVVMVIPNSHSVYPEKLPPGIESAPERPVHQLIAHLERAGSPVSLLYPLEEITAGKARDLVCSRTDSHWTDYGAFLGYSGLRQKRERSFPCVYSHPTRWCSNITWWRAVWVTSSIRSGSRRSPSGICAVAKPG